MEKENTYKPSRPWTPHAGRETEELAESLFYTRIRQQGVFADFITFRLKGERYHTLATGDLQELFFEPSEGIVCFFRFGIVKIKGRNLKDLHTHLRDRRITEIREFSGKPDLLFEPEALFIQSILYESENMMRLQ
jgi:hypothetical protein